MATKRQCMEDQGRPRGIVIGVAHVAHAVDGVVEKVGGAQEGSREGRAVDFFVLHRLRSRRSRPRSAPPWPLQTGTFVGLLGCHL